MRRERASDSPEQDPGQRRSEPEDNGDSAVDRDQVRKDTSGDEQSDADGAEGGAEGCFRCHMGLIQTDHSQLFFEDCFPNFDTAEMPASRSAL